MQDTRSEAQLHREDPLVRRSVTPGLVRRRSPRVTSQGPTAIVLQRVVNELNELINQVGSLVVEDGKILGSDSLPETLEVSILSLRDGTAAPATVAGRGQIYIDDSDGDLKIKFGDGTVKTITVDT